MNKVIIRSYCEAGCDCPKCHTGGGNEKLKDCVYCQLKWANCGQYNPKHEVFKRDKPKESFWCQCGNLIEK